jgi:hypothetical protein
MKIYDVNDFNDFSNLYKDNVPRNFLRIREDQFLTNIILIDMIVLAE